MERNERYIGTPNGVVVCVDRARGRELAGRAYQSYSREAGRFRSTEQLVFGLDRFYDSIHFPRRTMSERTFGPAKQTFPEKERRRVMSDEELLGRHGDLGTFIIRVQHRQNSSWQGRITWMEKNQTLSFRSVWELIRLMGSAVETVSGPEEAEPQVDWADT